MRRNYLLLILSLVLLALGILVSRLMFIPAWEEKQYYLFLSLFIAGALTALAFLFLTARHHWKSKQKVGFWDWASAGLLGLVLVGALGVGFFVLLLSMGQGIFGPEFRAEKELEGKTFYLYYHFCFPPDSMCECDYYHSIIYQRNASLPLMDKVGQVDFYVGEMKLLNGSLSLKASDDCHDHRGKGQILPL